MNGSLGVSVALSPAKAASAPPSSATSIFVGNLNWSTTREDLRAIFAPFGSGVVSLLTNRANGQPLGYALVEMPAHCAAMAIAQLHGTRLKGRCITVRAALSQRSEQEPTRRLGNR